MSLIIDQEVLRDRSTEQFFSLLNRLSTVEQIPQQPVSEELDLPASIGEIKKAITMMNSCRVSGKYGIPFEIYKLAGFNALAGLL